MFNKAPRDPECSMTAVEIMANRGYPVEVDFVTTEDGYILELHRIPHGKNEKNSPNYKRRPPVLLQHGFLGSSTHWILTRDDQALAYFLADVGYDVWMANSRGNTYSQKHVTLDSSCNNAYWDFSFDELGKYDIPAVIDHILTKTGHQMLSYIGHSLGCGIFYIAMHYYPELNEKIAVNISLAPSASMRHSKTKLKYVAPLVKQLHPLFNLFGMANYERTNSLEHRIHKVVSGHAWLPIKLSKIRVYSLTCEDYRNTDEALIPVIDSHNPAGSSLRTAVHFCQNYNAGQTFQAFDLGAEENMKRYGQHFPIAYDLSRVTCPVYIFYGEGDKTCVSKDILWLAQKIPGLKMCHQVEDPEWTHMDFVFSSDAKFFVYDKILPLLPKVEDENVM